MLFSFATAERFPATSVYVYGGSEDPAEDVRLERSATPISCKSHCLLCAYNGKNFKKLHSKLGEI